MDISLWIRFDSVQHHQDLEVFFITGGGGFILLFYKHLGHCILGYASLCNGLFPSLWLDGDLYEFFFSAQFLEDTHRL